jgi:hypothetical protein
VYVDCSTPRKNNSIEIKNHNKVEFPKKDLFFIANNKFHIIFNRRYMYQFIHSLSIQQNVTPLDM